MPNSIPEWHDYLLARLLAHRAADPAFTFSPRRIDDARFRAGYWFQGTERYLFCAPFKFNEPNNRTKTIGLVLLFDKGELTGINYDIVFGAPSCQEHLPFYRKVLELFGVEFEDTRWRYVVPAQGGIDAVIEDYCTRLVPAMTMLIREFALEDQYLVRDAELERALEKISARKKLGLVALTGAAQLPDAGEDDDAGAAAWLVGASWDGVDMAPRFVAEGRWENGYDDRYLDTVKAVREGDRIAIKTTYTQARGLPFDNRGESVSCMQIKARGRVIGNPGDGKHLTVQWESDFQPVTIYHTTYRRTISRIDAGKYPQVVGWVFDGVRQPLAAAPANAAAAGPADDAGLAERYGPSPRNVIFHGPPGTGKTRTLLEDVLPAYLGETEREPDEVHMTREAAALGWFEVIAAVLIEAGRPLRVPEIREHAFVAAKLRSGTAPKHLNQVIWATAQNHSIRASVTVNSSLERRFEPLVFDKDAESRWALVPDWKRIAPELAEAHSQLKPGGGARSATVERFEFVTFHPSFSYEDLVEGLRPVQVEQEDGSSTIDIVPRDGALKRICKRAKDDPDNRYALVIDEINRGNIAKIFGELITLVEADKRVRYDQSGRRIAGIEVTLPCTGERFGVPANVDFYGTMNTSDRSIALVDLALRRRFLFRAVLPDPTVIAGADGEGLIEADDDDAQIDLRRLLRVLNARLTVLRGPDTCIGHAYFTAIEDIDALRAAFRDRIIPLLQEYFFDDLEGVARVLTVRKGAVPFVRAITPQVGALFGPSADLDDVDEQPVWQVTRDMPADAFRALYDGVPDSALQLG